MTDSAETLLLIFALVALIVGLVPAAALITVLDERDDLIDQREDLLNEQADLTDQLAQANAQLEIAEQMLFDSRRRGRETEGRLAEAQRRATLASHLLAELQQIRPAFPDAGFPAANSDSPFADAVEAWLFHTPPTSED